MVNTDTVVGSDLPLLFMAYTLATYDWPGSRPVTLNAGIILVMLARILL